MDKGALREEAKTALERMIMQIEKLDRYVGDEVSVELYGNPYTPKGRLMEVSLRGPDENKLLGIVCGFERIPFYDRVEIEKITVIGSGRPSDVGQVIYENPGARYDIDIISEVASIVSSMKDESSVERKPSKGTNAAHTASWNNTEIMRERMGDQIYTIDYHEGKEYFEGHPVIHRDSLVTWEA